MKEALPGYLIVAASVALVAAALLLHPERYQGADYIGYALRVTAWISVGFFLLAYLARPLTRLGGVRSLVRSRRYLGLGMAFSHSVHFGYVVAYSRLPEVTVDLLTWLFGGAAFVLMWAMALTSNDASVRALGPNWKRLHRFGMHYLWGIFAFVYVGGALAGPSIDRLVLAGAFLGAAGLRAYVHLRRPAPQASVRPSSP